MARSHERHTRRTAATQVKATLHRMSLADHAASRAEATAQDAKAALWDELLQSDGRARRAAAPLVEHLESLGVAELAARQDAADLDMLAMGVTFTVYSDGRGIDRAWPFDVIPRVIDATEWRRIEAGLVQRLQALNQFIDDLYNDQQVDRGRRLPGRAAGRRLQLPARVRGRPTPVRRVGPHQRQRPGARPRRPGVRARGQPAGALGRQLPAREPARVQAGVRRPVRPPEHPTGRRLPRPALPAAGVARPRRGGRSHRRRAHPGRVQLGLLRAQLPRPPHGRPPRRGPRPVRGGRRRASTCAR